jgi:hypothetical protein
LRVRVVSKTRGFQNRQGHLMGGRGSGGRRVGSGRKPRANGPRGLVIGPPRTPAAPIQDTIEPPAELQPSAELAHLRSQLAFLEQGADLENPNPQIAELQGQIDAHQTTAAALAIWHELAPSALAKHTLTPETAAAFVMLCRAVVLERALSASPATAGGSNHRGLMHRVATWMKDFCLSPFGKPLTEATSAAPVVSKWAGLLR